MKGLNDMTPIKKIVNGVTTYTKNGRYHREDGPAIIWKDGTSQWYFNGKKHRDDGPAIDLKNVKIWYKNGKKHRDDGPAEIYSNDEYFWWNDGNNITEEVNEWILTNNVVDYKEWTNKEIAMFKLKFL